MDDGYMPTASGILFNLMEPNPDHINIDDIANGLSNNCRWNGQTQRFYSVAEHCIKCYWHYVWMRGGKENPANINKKAALAILLHDAEEAYWSDFITPVKNLLPDLKAKMDELRIMIYKKFDVYPDENTAILVHHIDQYILVWEYQNVMLNDNEKNYTSTEAKEIFMILFNKLTK